MEEVALVLLELSQHAVGEVPPCLRVWHLLLGPQSADVGSPVLDPTGLRWTEGMLGSGQTAR